MPGKKIAHSQINKVLEKVLADERTVGASDSTAERSRSKSAKGFKSIVDFEKNYLLWFAVIALFPFAYLFCISDGRAFEGALWRHWTAVMGGALSVVIGLVTRKWTLPRTIFWSIPIACLVFASFRAWRDEYSNTHPPLRMEIVNCGTGDGPQGRAVMILFVQVANLGPPSVADNWRLELNVPTYTSGTVSLRPLVIDPANGFEQEMENCTARQYQAKDLLNERSISTPIATGAKESGLLIFDLGGIPEKSLPYTTTNIGLFAEDVAGRVIQADYSKFSLQKRPSLPYYPGAEPTIPSLAK